MDGFGGQTWLYADSLTSAQADMFFSQTSGIGLELVRTGNTWDGSIPDLTTLQEAVARGAKVELGMQTPQCSIKHSYVDLGKACHTTDWNQNSGFGDGTPGNSGICFANGLSLTGSGGAYDQFASYIITTIQTYQNSSVPITWVSLQNEADDPLSGIGACQWGSGSQFQDLIKNYLGPKLASAGLSTKIILDPDTHWFNEDFVSACLNDSGCAQYVAVAGGHGYGYPFSPYSYPLGTSGGRHLWLSETSDQSNIWDSTMATALTMAQNMHNFMTVANVSAYEWWELAYPASGGNYGLTDSAFNLSKRLYVTGNWSKFVRPGWVRIGATAAPQTGVYVTAFEDPSSGAFAIVAINSNGGSISQQFSLAGLTTGSVTPYITDSNNNLASQASVAVASGSFAVTLTPQSVTTLVAGSSGPGAPTNLTGKVN